MSLQRVPLVGLVGLLVATAVSAGSNPVAVSPGDASKLALIEDRCPTFIWGSAAGAGSFELVVYRLGQDGEEAKPVLRKRFPGTVSGWTPTLDACLERGGRYAWSVRAVVGREPSAWSPPNLFQVTPGPTETQFEQALAVVRAFLAERRVGAGSDPEILPIAEPPEGARLAGDEERGDAPPATAQPIPTPPSWGIRAESPEDSGSSHGVAGISRSLLGSGLVAANTGGGIDLLLSGWEDGETDARITESGIDRPSAAAETFTIGNSGAGTMSLIVTGEVSASTLSGDGSGLTGVTAADLGCTECVSAAEIGLKAVLGEHIAGDEIESGHLALGAVRSDDIQDGQVLSQDIGNDAVEAAEIATGAVGSSEILDNSILQIDIATDAVGAEEIRPDAVGWDEIANGSVRSDEIATNAVGSDEIATDAVGSDEIAAGAVGWDEIAQEAVGRSRLGRVQAVFVDCNGSCSGYGTLSMYCGAGYSPIAVSCDSTATPTGGLEVDCGPTGSNDKCNRRGLSRLSPLTVYCADGSGYDAIVFCLAGSDPD